MKKEERKKLMHTFLYALLGVLVASCGGGGGGGSGGGSSIIPTMPNIIEQPKKNFGNDKKVEEPREILNVNTYVTFYVKKFSTL